MKRGRTALFDDVKAGLLPPPIKIGARAVAWVERECSAVLESRIAGANDEQVRQLVRKLVAERASKMPKL